MEQAHQYSLQVKWTGNTGNGTSNYRAYERAHIVFIEGKPVLDCSSDAAFRGDKTKYTPEELLVASISGCHMLWYLHLCSEAAVVVTDYLDYPTGIMAQTANGGGYFTEVTLRPIVTVTERLMVDKAIELHKKANELCFIAKSVNFPVLHRPTCKVGKDQAGY